MKRLTLSLLLAISLPALADRLPPRRHPEQLPERMRQLPPALPARPAGRQRLAKHHQPSGSRGRQRCQPGNHGASLDARFLVRSHLARRRPPRQRRQPATHHPNHALPAQAPRGSAPFLARSTHQVGCQLRSLVIAVRPMVTLASTTSPFRNSWEISKILVWDWPVRIGLLADEVLN